MDDRIVAIAMSLGKTDRFGVLLEHCRPFRSACHDLEEALAYADTLSLSRGDEDVAREYDRLIGDLISEIRHYLVASQTGMA